MRRRCLAQDAGAAAAAALLLWPPRARSLSRNCIHRPPYGFRKHLETDRKGLAATSVNALVGTAARPCQNGASPHSHRPLRAH